MILIDANILIYAVNVDAPLHRRAKSWIETVLSGPDSVGFAWIALFAFLRLTTRPGLFAKPLAIETAFDLVHPWLAQPAAVILDPAEQHLRIVRDLVLPLGVGGNLISDAHMAALAIEHGAELCTCDTDFQRFRRLRWRNPLGFRDSLIPPPGPAFSQSSSESRMKTYALTRTSKLYFLYFQHRSSQIHQIPLTRMVERY